MIKFLKLMSGLFFIIAVPHFCYMRVQISCQDKGKFVLMTSLYNETDEDRRNEYITCLEKNLDNPHIESIHVLYDVIKDDEKDDKKNILLQYLKSNKMVKITYIKKRPSFDFCFGLANRHYLGKKIILSNADIYFNETLELLKDYNLKNKFLALSRWNVRCDGELELMNDKWREFSQDCWIFKTPLRQFVKAHYRLGTFHCDSYIACGAHQSGLMVSNPCLSVQACHLHLSEVRHYCRKRRTETMMRVPWQELS